GLDIVLDEGRVVRTIVAIDSTGYKVNEPYPADWEYPFYEIINRVGSLRIKKPTGPSAPDISDFSLVELYTPAVSFGDTDYERFYTIGLKMPVIDWGTDEAMHGGN